MKRTVFSLFFYTMGLVGLFLTDLLINHYFSSQDIKTWVLNKSLMMMVGPLLLLGYNNNFLRYPEKIKVNLNLTFKLLLFWLILAIFFEYLLVLEFSPLLAVFFAFNLMITSFLRINRDNLIAQINQSIWKILLFILVVLVVFIGFPIDYFYLLLLFFLLIPTILAVDFKKLNTCQSNSSLTKEEHKFARQMLLSAMLLNIATYGELFLLANFYSPDIVSEYFLYFTLFTASGIFISGFLGFYLTPKIRNNPIRTINYVSFNVNKIYFLIFLIASINFLIGVTYLYAFENKIDYVLVLSFLILGVLKILYIWPTARMGALANSINLKEFLISNLLLTILYILLILSFVYFNLNIYYIVLIVLFNWVLRVWIANSVAYKLEIG